MKERRFLCAVNAVMSLSVGNVMLIWGGEELEGMKKISQDMPDKKDAEEEKEECGCDCHESFAEPKEHDFECCKFMNGAIKE